MTSKTVFLSAVSGEFREAREALARELRKAGCEVMEQADFDLEPANPTLLGKLRAYIESCDTVICLLGQTSGFMAPPGAEEPFRNLLPDGVDREPWSYTQWEGFFAEHYHRPTIRVRAIESWLPGPPDPRQAAYLALLDHTGADLTRSAENAHHAQLIVLRAMGLIAAEGTPFNVPFPSIANLFMGREPFMARLRESFRSANTPVVIRAVQGMGGVGKTRAAVEYAHRHRGDYAAVLFVGAADPAALETNLAALTGVLRLPEDAVPEHDRRLAAVLRWLETHRDWLLILDNVDTPEALEAAAALWPRLEKGHVLLTSRLDGGFEHGIEILDIGLLEEADAVAYLLSATPKRRPEPDEAARVLAVARALDGLTLAVVIAAAYVNERRITFSRYLADWTANRDAVLEFAPKAVTRYPESLATTWLTSMARLTGSGQALLELLSFFANDPVPEFLLDVAVPGAETAEGLDPLLDLQRYSLIARDPAADRFTIHRIVRDVTNRRLATDPAAHRTRLTEALGWINAAFEGEPQDARSWPRLTPLAPHAEAVAEAADEVGIADPTARLMDRVGTLHQFKAQFARAEPLMRRALAIIEANLGAHHPDVAIPLNNLALLLKDTNRLTEAEPLMRRALAIGEASPGADHPNVTIRLSNLALLLQATNRLAEAEALMRRALAINEASLGADHPNVARDLNNLGFLLQATNRLTQAEPLYRRALAIREASLGADHPSVAIALNNLAMLLQAANRLEEAEPLMRRGLEIDDASLGADHPDVARDLNNLASLLQATNRLAQAEPLYRRALAIHEASLGADHPNVAIGLSNLTRVLKATNRGQEGEPLVRRALAILEASLGPDHPLTGRIGANLADVLDRIGQTAEARERFRRALAILAAQVRAIGRAHPWHDEAERDYRAFLAAQGEAEPAIDAEIAAARSETGLPISDPRPRNTKNPLSSLSL